MDRYYYKLYPNIYVFLVAKSGLRKSNPVTLIKKITQESSAVRIISGRNSVQAILKDLGKAHSVEGGGVIKDASGFLCSGELAAFLVKDPEALTILTDLYDTYANEPEWKNTLKVSGIDTLKNPCLTLLGATNEEHFKEAVPPTAIGGGFIARTFIVYESKRRTINSLMKPPKVVPSVKDLADYLKQLSKLEGIFEMTEPVRHLYDSWYNAFTMESSQDTTGTVERLGDGVLKVAMLLSMSEGLSLNITTKHIEESIEVCTECLAGLKHVTMGAGKSEFAFATALILKEMIKAPEYKVTRRKLLSKYWGEFDSIVLDRIIENLLNAHAVIVHDYPPKDRTYEMKKEAVEMYTKFRKEIN